MWWSPRCRRRRCVARSPQPVTSSRLETDPLRVVQQQFALGGAARADVLRSRRRWRNPGHPAAVAKAAGADARSTTALAGRLPSQEPAATLRSGRPAAAAGLAGQPALAAGRAAAGRARGGGAAASQRAPIRRGDRQPVAAVQHHRPARHRRRWASPTCSDPATAYGASAAASRRRSSTPAHCCTRSAPRSPLSTRPRRSTAAP